MTYKRTSQKLLNLLESYYNHQALINAEFKKLNPQQEGDDADEVLATAYDCFYCKECAQVWPLECKGEGDYCEECDAKADAEERGGKVSLSDMSLEGMGDYE